MHNSPLKILLIGLVHTDLDGVGDLINRKFLYEKLGYFVEFNMVNTDTESLRRDFDDIIHGLNCVNPEEYEMILFQSGDVGMFTPMEGEVEEYSAKLQAITEKGIFVDLGDHHKSFNNSAFSNLTLKIDGRILKPFLYLESPNKDFKYYTCPKTNMPSLSPFFEGQQPSELLSVDGDDGTRGVQMNNSMQKTLISLVAAFKSNHDTANDAINKAISAIKNSKHSNYITQMYENYLNNLHILMNIDEYKPYFEYKLDIESKQINILTKNNAIRIKKFQREILRNLVVSKTTDDLDRGIRNQEFTCKIVAAQTEYFNYALLERKIRLEKKYFEKSADKKELDSQFIDTTIKFYKTLRTAANNFDIERTKLHNITNMTNEESAKTIDDIFKNTYYKRILEETAKAKDKLGYEHILPDGTTVNIIEQICKKHTFEAETQIREKDEIYAIRLLYNANRVGTRYTPYGEQMRDRIAFKNGIGKDYGIADRESYLIKITTTEGGIISLGHSLNTLKPAIGFDIEGICGSRYSLLKLPDNEVKIKKTLPCGNSLELNTNDYPELSELLSQSSIRILPRLVKTHKKDSAVCGIAAGVPMRPVNQDFFLERNLLETKLVDSYRKVINLKWCLQNGKDMHNNDLSDAQNEILLRKLPILEGRLLRLDIKYYKLNKRNFMDIIHTIFKGDFVVRTICEVAWVGTAD